MRSAVPVLAVAGALGVAALFPARAHAHPLVDEGRRRFEQADFDGALDAFSRAEQATDLTREDLEQLYLRRALVEQAMHRTEDMQVDLFRLATLDPQVALGREVPPAVRRAFTTQAARVTAQMRVSVDATPMPGGVKLEARVDDDAAGIVQAVRVSARVAGGAWQHANGATLELQTAAGARVEYHAEAIGPGGAAVANAGTESEPLVTNGPGTALVAGGGNTGGGNTGGGNTGGGNTGGGNTGGPAPITHGGGTDVGLIVGVIVVAVLVVAAAIIIPVALLSGPDQNVFGPPTL